MSLCVALQQKNELFMCGDSRMSVNIDGKKYRWNDNYNKIEQIGNMVIFKGGNAEIMNIILDRFKCSKDKSIDSFNNICKNEFTKFVNLNYRKGIEFKPFSETNNITIGAIIGLFEKDIPILYCTSDALNFEVIRVELPEEKEINDVFFGVQCDEARKIYTECNFDFNDFGNVFNNYKTIFEGVTGTEIGGTLTVYHITKDKIEKKQCGLQNPKYVDEFADYLLGKNNVGANSGHLTCKALYIGGSQVNAVNGNQIDDSAVNIKASTIDALNITAKSVSSDWVYAGTINANQINTVGLGAEKIYQPGNTNNYLAIRNATWGPSMGLLKNGSIGLFDISDQGDGDVTLSLGGAYLLRSPISGSDSTEVHGDWDVRGNMSASSEGSINATTLNNNTLSDLDGRYVCNMGGQNIRLQVYDGNLEIWDGNDCKGVIPLS